MADAQAPRSRRAVPVQSAWLHSARSVRRRSHSHTKSNAQTRVSDRPTLRILRGVFGATVRRARRPPAHDTARSPRLWLDCTHDAARPAGRASPAPQRVLGVAARSAAHRHALTATRPHGHRAAPREGRAALAAPPPALSRPPAAPSSRLPPLYDYRYVCGVVLWYG